VGRIYSLFCFDQTFYFLLYNQGKHLLTECHDAHSNLLPNFYFFNLAQPQLCLFSKSLRQSLNKKKTLLYIYRPQNSARQSKVVQRIVEQSAVGQNAVGQNAVGQNAVGQNAVGQNAVGQNAVGQNAVGVTVL
jgi:hypothetical protein